jgi:hypothetical protein
MHHHRDEPQRRPSRTKWILLAFAVIAGFFLYTEHQAHLYGALPYLLILLCPLMHLFHGHGNHGGSHAGHDADSHRPPEDKSAAALPEHRKELP